MQKKIIALAVAGLMSGAAFAQTNVTVYGVADLTFDNVKAAGAENSGFNMPSRNRVSANSSYLGFKGTEDLGGGMKALFQFEGGVGADTGGAFSFARDSYVGLGGNFGTVLLGNLTGPTRALGAAMDVNAGATGIGANTGLLGKLGGDRLLSIPAVGAVCGSSATCTSTFDTRWTNAIAYVSPSFSGLTATAAYVANENKTRSGLEGGASQLNTRGYDAGLNYNNGPIMVALTYNKVKVGDTANTDAADTRLGGKYNGGNWTAGLLWDRVKVSDSGGSDKRTAWFIPVTFNVTANGKIIGQYGKAGDISGLSDTGAKMFALGYEHSLSKRTMIKAVWSQISNDKFAVYDFGVNSVGIGAGSLSGAGADPKGFQVGVRHTF